MTGRHRQPQEAAGRRRKLGAAGIAVIVVAVAAIVAAAAAGVHESVTHSSTPQRHQTTVLMQVAASDGSAAVSALLAHDSGSHRGVELLVPGQLIANVCGYGTEPFADVLGQTNGAAVSQQTLSSLLGDVTIDGSWVLTEAQLAQLVDLVHGVPVDGGTQTGQQAVAYATRVASRTEDASVQLARTQQVIDALLRKLPTSTAAVAADLRRLGSGGQSSLGADRLAGVLVGLAADGRRAGGVYPSDLPVTQIDTGGAPSYQVDTAGVQQLVDQRFAASKPKHTGVQSSVELLNGVGKPGLVATACPRLAAGGFSFAGSGNAGHFGYGRSQVQVADASKAALGARVAHALGLPASDVRTQPVEQTVADVVVILGRDYKP